MWLKAPAPISAVARFPTVIVCASFEPERHESKALLAWLRRLDRQGARPLRAVVTLETGDDVPNREALSTMLRLDPAFHIPSEGIPRSRRGRRSG